MSALGRIVSTVLEAAAQEVAGNPEAIASLVRGAYEALDRGGVPVEELARQLAPYLSQDAVARAQLVKAIADAQKFGASEP